MSSPTPEDEDQAVQALADQDALEAANAAAGNPTPGTEEPPARAPLSAAQEQMLNEDWAKLPAWDVTGPDGEPVTTLDALAEVLGVEDRHAAASELLASPASVSAPAELLAEARAEVNPDPDQASLFDELVAADTAAAEEGLPPAGGLDDDEEGPAPTGGADDDDSEYDDEEDDRPAFLKKGANPFAKGNGGKGPDTGDGARKETIAAGAFVSGPFGKGKVEVVVTSGTVPGVDTDVEGTKAEPAVRVRVYEADGDDWKATERRVAAKVGKLKTIPPLGAAKFGKKSGAAGLVLLTAQAAQLPDDQRPEAKAIRTAYQRGLNAYPEGKAAISREEWALQRAEAFVQLCQGVGTQGYVGDDDLLP
jgi:hypothetical protein